MRNFLPPPVPTLLRGCCLVALGLGLAAVALAAKSPTAGGSAAATLAVEPAGAAATAAAGTADAQPREPTPGLLLDRGGIVLNVKDPPFGAVGEGITDDAPAINRALEAARKTGEYGQGVEGTIVYIPPGIYRLDMPLDMNGRQFNVVGAGGYQTVLRGNTGDRHAVVEMVGTGFSKLSGVLIDDLVDALPEAERNPSSVGVLLARVDAPQNISDYSGPRFAAQSWNNNLEDVAIRLRTRPPANGGRGTVAYYNFCSEVSGWHNCFFLADTGALISAANMYGVQMKTVRDVEWRPGVPERMRMWAGESSMTVVRASGASSVFGITGPALLIGGASDISIDSCMAHMGHLYLADAPASWPKYAIEVVGTCHNLAYRGSIEAYPGAVRVVGAQLSALSLNAYMDPQPMHDAKGAEVDSVPIVMLDKKVVEHPTGSGTFTHAGSSLTNSHLEPATTPATPGVVGRLIDTSPDAGHVIQGNHLTLGNLKVRLRNGWSSSILRANVATSTLPLGSGQFEAAGDATRGGNLLAAADGVGTDAAVRPGTVHALPAAAAGHRGKMLRVEGGDGASDRLFICEKDAAGAYAWRQI